MHSNDTDSVLLWYDLQTYLRSDVAQKRAVSILPEAALLSQMWLLRWWKWVSIASMLCTICNACNVRCTSQVIAEVEQWEKGSKVKNFGIMGREF